MTEKKGTEKELAQLWLEWDRNSETRAEIEALVAKNDVQELNKRLRKQIAFGTAGLRGRMQAGFSFMNDLTVTEASQGLCLYMEKQITNFKEKGIVVGYDGRHHSKSFAELTAATFVSRGVKVYLFSVLAATPLVPFAIDLFKCAGGVMVTASHNPKDDNGYKVYWDNGAQIVEPHDAGISTSIDQNMKPWDLKVQELLKSPLVIDPTHDVEKSYFAEISKRYCTQHTLNSQFKQPIVYTPMHGVGHRWMEQAFKAFGIPEYIQVKEQIKPDADFPTVAFPNPEEGKGALKLAMKTADEVGSTLIVANDPDADRLAIAEKLPNGEWKIFTGNEIGILLTDYTWQQYKKQHEKDADFDPKQCAVLNSTVSSKMMSSLAKKEGIYYEDTLTGFKWLGNKADDLRKKGKKFIFAFEEAIGFMVGDTCLDKDGIRAGAVFTEMAIGLYTNKKTCVEHLEELYVRYGYFETNNRYFFCYDPKLMEKIFEKIRNGGQYCKQVGSFPVAHIRDLTVGIDTHFPDKKPVLPVSSGTHMITFYFENGCQATLRGSGTEPKLKYYIEMSGNDKKEVHETLQKVVDAVIEQCLEPEKNGLQKPKD